MKLIEFFKWDHEGEYQQYFYAVEDEKAFVQDVLKYLNTVHIKTDYPWADSLCGFKAEEYVDPYFLHSYIDHLREYYYINYNNDAFTLTKQIERIDKEEFKWQEH